MLQRPGPMRYTSTSRRSGRVSGASGVTWHPEKSPLAKSPPASGADSRFDLPVHGHAGTRLAGGGAGGGGEDLGVLWVFRAGVADEVLGVRATGETLGARFAGGAL